MNKEDIKTIYDERVNDFAQELELSVVRWIKQDRGSLPDRVYQATYAISAAFAVVLWRRQKHADPRCKAFWFRRSRQGCGHGTRRTTPPPTTLPAMPEGHRYQSGIRRRRKRGIPIMSIHPLRSWPEFFEPVLEGRKRFEL